MEAPASSAPHNLLTRLSNSILDKLTQTPSPQQQQPKTFSTKSTLLSLLTIPNGPLPEPELRVAIHSLTLVCAALLSSSAAAEGVEELAWIPASLREVAGSALEELASSGVVGGLGVEGLVVELLPELVVGLKERIKESCVGDGDEVSAASARAPVGSAVLASYQFTWLVLQVGYPHLGKMCTLVTPCALTALDHWSPEVKGQGMMCFIHLAQSVNATELSLYQDVILDACCQNIACADEIWHLVVEMSVLCVTLFQHNNPRSPWFERLLNEMLSHLERQPRNKDRRVAWLKFIEPLFISVGLVLLAHSRWLFPLFFQWMHADDDETVLLVLKQLQTVIRLTWIRNTPCVERLVNELVILFKEAALRRARDEIRAHILKMLILLKQCKGRQFEEAWDKHSDDQNLTILHESLSGNNMKVGDAYTPQLNSNNTPQLNSNNLQCAQQLIA